MVQWHRGAFRTGMVQRTVVAFRSVRQDATSEGIVQKLRAWAEKKVSNFNRLRLTSLVWKLQSWQASEPSAFTVSRR